MMGDRRFCVLSVAPRRRLYTTPPQQSNAGRVVPDALRGTIMSKTIVADAIQTVSGLDAKTARHAAIAALDAITKTLLEQGKFVLAGFGTFTTKNLPARTGMNPSTRAKFAVAASKTVRFKMSPAFKERLAPPVAAKPAQKATAAKTAKAKAPAKPSRQPRQRAATNSSQQQRATTG